MANLLTGSDLVTAAKNIRKELAEAFKGTKFTVRSSRFSGGDSIDIGWTDGPTVKQVEEIAEKYKDGDFDGMTDSYNYRRDDFTSKHGGAKYVSTSRRFSPEMVAEAIKSLAAEYNAAEVPTVEDYENGRAWNTTPLGGQCNNYWCWQSLITRKCSETSR